MPRDPQGAETRVAHRVVVTGGRDYANEAAVFSVLDLEPITELAAGDASGADEIAHRWARINGVKHYTYVADWKKHGKAAGPIRNREMLDDFKPDCVIALDGGRGTQDCINAAKERGIPVHDFRITRHPIPPHAGEETKG